MPPQTKAEQAQDADVLAKSPDGGLLGRWTWDEAQSELKSCLCETELAVRRTGGVSTE